MNAIRQFQNRPEGVEDPEIISWCRDNKRVWITHDIKARKRHEAGMKVARINVVWIRGSPQDFSTWRFFKAIVRTIDELQRFLLSSHGAMHFSISIRDGPRPKVLWTESPFDQPKPSK